MGPLVCRTAVEQMLLQRRAFLWHERVDGTQHTVDSTQCTAMGAQRWVHSGAPKHTVPALGAEHQTPALGAVHQTPALGLCIKLQHWGLCIKLQHWGLCIKLQHWGLCIKLQHWGLCIKTFPGVESRQAKRKRVCVEQACKAQPS